MNSSIRELFPVFTEDPGLSYLDNAASTQVPQAVLDVMNDYYRLGHANVDRGVHRLGQRSTAAYEGARGEVAGFIGADSASEVVFVRGATEAANLVANAWLLPRLVAGDRVLVTVMEHHSNYLPWLRACRQAGASLEVIGMDDAGNLDLEQASQLLSQPGCRLLAVTHASNVTGTVNPVAGLAEEARRNGVAVFVDGAQAVPHAPVNVGEIGCDFYAFSGHKMHAPTGIGVLFARADALADMDAWQSGGGMILDLDGDEIQYKSPPAKFEAGTPNIIGAVGLAEASRFLRDQFRSGLEEQEGQLMRQLLDELAAHPRVRLVARPDQQLGVTSFTYDGVHAHDVGSILDASGVAVRVGHHCAIPLMRRLGVPAVVRVSLACYNTADDVAALMSGLEDVQQVFGGQ